MNSDFRGPDYIPERDVYLIGEDTIDIAVVPGCGVANYGSQFVIPREFKARVDDTRYPAVIAMRVVVADGGRAECDLLECSRRAGGPPITGEVLREIPVAAILRDVLAAAALEIQFDAEGARLLQRAGQARLDDLFVKYHEVTREPARRGVPVTDGRLREVASVYRGAALAGLPATKTVAEVMHVSRSTAARWVMKARDAGLLGKARPGRSGEITIEGEES